MAAFAETIHAAPRSTNQENFCYGQNLLHLLHSPTYMQNLSLLWKSMVTPSTRLNASGVS